jgi:hypothetical protein
MIEGTLLVNLNPPYIGFASEDVSEIKHTSTDELTKFLIDLAQAEPGTCLPREFQARISGRFSIARLSQYGLLLDERYH